MRETCEGTETTSYHPHERSLRTATTLTLVADVDDDDDDENNNKDVRDADRDVSGNLWRDSSGSGAVPIAKPLPCRTYGTACNGIITSSNEDFCISRCNAASVFPRKFPIR